MALHPRPLRTPWGAFPDVTILSNESVIKRHPAYPAAKAGDVVQADALIEANVMETHADAIGRAVAGRQVTLVAAHAVEAEGINRIPAALAAVLGERLALPVDLGIVQIDRVSHTGASGWHRLAFPALFDGEVSAGQAYVLVDDLSGKAAPSRTCAGSSRHSAADAYWQ